MWLHKSPAAPEVMARCLLIKSVIMFKLMLAGQLQTGMQSTPLMVTEVG